MNQERFDETPTHKARIVHNQAQGLLMQTHAEIRESYEVAKTFTPEEIRSLGLNRLCLPNYMSMAFLDVDDLVEPEAVDSKFRASDKFSYEELADMVKNNTWGNYAGEILRLKLMAMDYITAVEGSKDFDDAAFLRVGRSRLHLTEEDIKRADDSHGRVLMALRGLIRKKV